MVLLQAERLKKDLSTLQSSSVREIDASIVEKTEVSKDTLLRLGYGEQH